MEMKIDSIMKIVRAMNSIREIAKGYDTKKEEAIHLFLREIEGVLESE